MEKILQTSQSRRAKQLGRRLNAIEESMERHINISRDGSKQDAERLYSGMYAAKHFGLLYRLKLAFARLISRS